MSPDILRRSRKHPVTKVPGFEFRESAHRQGKRLFCNTIQRSRGVSPRDRFSISGRLAESRQEEKKYNFLFGKS
ncbi:MAG TPA: hypothetical protein DFL85_03530 [Lentisphaeria bacterium]|nr:hypothetical protein [Lentisphaeria bacterium]HCH84563.1 hypothetical protein [Lentisphaeria bacterium]